MSYQTFYKKEDSQCLHQILEAKTYQPEHSSRMGSDTSSNKCTLLSKSSCLPLRLYLAMVIGWLNQLKVFVNFRSDKAAVVEMFGKS